MAQTLTVQASIRESTTTGGGFAGTAGLTVTTTGNSQWSQRGSVATTEEEWTISTEIVDAGQCVITNFDATNYVDVGFATGVYPLRIKAGGTDKLSLTPATASLFLKANTAACVVQVKVYEA